MDQWVEETLEANDMVRFTSPAIERRPSNPVELYLALASIAKFLIIHGKSSPITCQYWCPRSESNRHCVALGKRCHVQLGDGGILYCCRY